MNAWALILLLTPMFFSCASPSKSEFDAEVKRLCAIDGGIKIYETVTLTADRFDKYGNIYIPMKSAQRETEDYFLEWRADHLQSGNPSMRRDHFLIYRKADEKLLGEAVSYGRRGGDTPGPWHESSFRCPPEAGDQDLIRRIFRKQN